MARLDWERAAKRDLARPERHVSLKPAWWLIPARAGTCDECGEPVASGDPLAFNHDTKMGICKVCWENRGLVPTPSRRWNAKVHAQKMTAQQAKYLKSLCQKYGRTFSPSMSKAEASALIEELKAKQQAERLPYGSREAALANRCPTCGARPGKPCKRANGAPRKGCHIARHDKQ